MTIYGDKYNMKVTNTGQGVTFHVDGRAVLTVDITDTDLVDVILAASA